MKEGVGVSCGGLRDATTSGKFRTFDGNVSMFLGCLFLLHLCRTNILACISVTGTIIFKINRSWQTQFLILCLLDRASSY